VNAIEFHGVSFSYRDETILRDTTLAIPQGARIGLVGPSGCGKSTLLKLVAGLYAPDSGTLAVLGETDTERLHRHVAMVLQPPLLFPASIRDNITCGHDMPEERILAACEAAQLSGWLRGLPDGLDTYVGERGNRLSGGQSQRICIARAIARQSPILLMDEATSALDVPTGAAVMGALRSLMKGKTVVSATHDLARLEGFDRILQFREGRLHEIPS